VTELGVKQVADTLHESLLRYIEAQYHVRDTDVIEERRKLLHEAGVIGQEPYLETTPAYAVAASYPELGLPEPVGSTLAEFAALDPGIGVFPHPYQHQAEALQRFFVDGKDLVVATGTGSGKTETFLFPMIGQLLLEAAARPESWAAQGMRAIILYPMNALVSDQLARLRRLLGDERVATLFRTRYGRQPRFGMYTSRTPYPGVRDSTRDSKQIGPVLQYFQGLEHPSTADPRDVRERKARLVTELKARGRWPAKDLAAFAGQSGARWDSRLVTGASDRELLTRHEMHRICPDVLITNYSMLEYMLVRPIERSLFRKTKEWLAKDAANQLTLVIDEAHMYRGVGGAEVALLIRRLQARFEVPRDRIRCILTSASLSEGPEARTAGEAFAVALTGGFADGRSPFAVVQGTTLTRPNARKGTRAEAQALGTLDLTAFFARGTNLPGAAAAVAAVATAAQWPAPPAASAVDEAVLRRYLATVLTALPPMALLMNETAGHALAFSALAHTVFDASSVDEATAATTALLALGTYANDGTRPLLPARAHLFFRGLPTLYACIDPHCTARRHKRPEGGPYTLGCLYTEPRTHCTCDSRARVYEVYAHRDCGSVFLRVFGRGASPGFYWHERGGAVDPLSTPFDEGLLALEDPHPNMLRPGQERVEPIWIEMTTGRVLPAMPASLADAKRYRRVWRPMSSGANPLLRTGRKAGGKRTMTAVPAKSLAGQGVLLSCPNCTKKTGYKIMDLATKGEQPFANLVRTQLELQPAVRPFERQFPNGGRKVLLFSDGRQKAARLARDLPREVEFDSFRQALALAILRMEQHGFKVALDDRLYRAFVTVCHDFNLFFFDQEGNQQQQLIRDTEAYRTRYAADLQTLMEEGQGMRPPSRFRLALLRQLADPYYSLYSACAAVVEPSDRTMRTLRTQLAQAPTPFPASLVESELLGVVAAWIQALLEPGAFDPEIGDFARRQVNEYFKPWKAHDKVDPLERLLIEQGGCSADQVEFFRERLYDLLTRDDEQGNPYLVPAELKLRLAIDVPWFQCRACGLSQHVPVYNRCVGCGTEGLIERQPGDPYMTSRNDFIREPLRAVLAGRRPMHVTAEEHTAQLSQRDRGEVYATTEEYELRFQDVLIDVDKPPVDVLSCTTTMEVGIDIGSLTAVGLRNVPPQRENYQQRAGRSGRRGAAVSTVVTYAQGGPHDHHYYGDPAAIISGAPREPTLKTDNRRLAARHVHSYLVQTYFHETLDRIGQDAEDAIAASRTHLMSALGDAREFFLQSGDFSCADFQRWLARRVTDPGAKLADTIADWLPAALVPAGTPSACHAAKRAFAVATAVDFVAHLTDLGATLNAPAPPGPAASVPGLEDEERPMLLDALFDAGLLPSYAFPTSLASFYVFGYENGQHGVIEKPQQGKDKALSEYAPGRQLVVDKQTYRVGGIFTEDGRALNPGDVLFATPLPVYVSCPSCTHVELRDLAGQEPRRCPVCMTALDEHSLLDPPAFVPEGAKALPERDRNQEMSYATEAQFPSPLRPLGLTWSTGPSPVIQYAYQENQELVIANCGPKRAGFVVCETCGAAWPEADCPTSGRHVRPYPITPAHRQAGINRECNGHLTTSPLYLGFTFRTDILVLQIGLRTPLNYGANHPWLHDALRSTAESLTLAAGRLLDIDPGDLAAGYRMMPAGVIMEGTYAMVEIFLYDTAAGGAGYAAEAGEHLTEILEFALALVTRCPTRCERSCTRCLRYYGNRFWHERLDRRLAADVLRYALTGQAPALQPVSAQAETLVGLARYLELEGWTVRHPVPEPGVPLVVERRGVSATVGTHPALLTEEFARQNHSASHAPAAQARRLVLLNDYIVNRDLPTAYSMLRNDLPT
jgi:ATP-dependent helicase YprA (DUF1998 family)